MNIRTIIRQSLILAKYEIKLRNEGSYLGILWYLLNPIILFVLLFFIFRHLTGNDIELYPLYLLLGIIMYNLFQNVTNLSVKVINTKAELIKSIPFQKEVLILSMLIAGIFVHIFELLLFGILLIIFKINPIGIIFYPLILAFYALFIYGLSLIVSSICTRITDVNYIWHFFARLVFFVTPIFHQFDENSKLFLINLINPLYYFITIAREIIVYNSLPNPFIVIGAVSFSLIFLIIGIMVFNSQENKFVEII